MARFRRGSSSLSFSFHLDLPGLVDFLDEPSMILRGLSFISAITCWAVCGKEELGRGADDCLTMTIAVS